MTLSTVNFSRFMAISWFESTDLEMTQGPGEWFAPPEIINDPTSG